MKTYLTFLLFALSFCTMGQSEDIIAPHAGEKEVKIVVRTEEKLEDRYIAIDNLTIKVFGDSSKVYYMNYGDGMVSSMMIPFPVYDKYIAFEESLKEYHCLSETCKYSVLVEVGETSKRYIIDILHMEAVSSLMLELEN